MKEGKSSGGTDGYFGPAPPPGHGVHRYHFELFALDDEPELPPHATKRDILHAMRGHVLASGEIVGTYER
jgi:phosphatidylethanolamine-binding protein (PEBP) family uncharacterized protein